MSESKIKLSAKFDDLNIAQEFEVLMNRVINEIFEEEKELALHDFLVKNNQTKGVSFDSWWMPEVFERRGKRIKLELVGCPSGAKEQDIVTWIKLYGAQDISGELSVNAGGDVEVYKLCENEGNDMDERDFYCQEEHISLRMSLGEQCLSCVQYWIEKEADVNEVNRLSGMTPIFTLLSSDSEKWSLECMEALVSAGADINARWDTCEVSTFEADYMTPLDYAKRYGDTKAIDFLEKLGAK